MTKVFVIGHNKTGTTTLKMVLKHLGLRVAPQDIFEREFPNWKKRDFSNIISLAQKYEAFQDIPFSLPETYKHLDTAFPNSKFILTLRPFEEWYSSLVRFHSQNFNKGKLPTLESLKKVKFSYPNFAYDTVTTLYSTEEKLYDKDKCREFFETYNRNIINYFKNTPEKLLVLNIPEDAYYDNLMTFLGIEKSQFKGKPFPVTNSSR